MMTILSKLRSPVLRSSIACSSAKKFQVGGARRFLYQDLPNEADVVIIGGGSLGCNTLYHLTQKGLSNVVLLDKDKLTAGTTWHTAGLVWNLRPNDTDIELLQHTRVLLERLESETGIDPGWINNGGLFIANSRERFDEYRNLHTLGKAFGVESHLLDQAETKQLYPLINESDVFGALYSPRDGTVDPNGFCHALSRASTSAGAKLIEGCSVTDIKTKDLPLGSKGVTEVVTNRGSIRTECVVNCTGAWANCISHMVGIHTPLVAMKHAYVCTDRIEGIQGMPNIRDHDASVYLKLQGDCLHIGGYEVNPIFIDEMPKEFAFGLFELDWDVFQVHMEGAVNRVPILEHTGIKSTICGPESFTPDHKPLLGEDPRVRGFFHGCGFNSAGMMFGGGCGNQLAEWIIHGRPAIDMHSFDIRRFCPEVSRNLAWIKERSHESYVKNYSIVFPHDEPLSGRDQKQDPLHNELLEQGCVFQERLGWERPAWFSVYGSVPLKPYDWYGAYDHLTHGEYGYRERLLCDYTFSPPAVEENIRAECLATRESAALFNMSYFGKFLLSGPDAQKAADWIFSNSVNAQQQSGQTIYTCMLNQKGGIEADLTVSVLEASEAVHPILNPGRQGPKFYVAAAGAYAFHNVAHISQAIQDQRLDVQIETLSHQLGMLSLQGPKSRDILANLTQTDLSNEAFPFSTHKILDIQGQKVRAMRVSFVGELGWELHIPNESCLPVYRALMEVGRPFGLINAGYRAMDSLSIEKGYPHWHHELRLNDTPLDAGLMFTCKMKSDIDFLGKEALQGIQLNGTFRKKAGFTLDNRGVCLNGLEIIYRDGIVVGTVRRGEFAHYLHVPVAYGYVHHPEGEKISNQWIQAGEYEIEHMGDRYPAKIHLKSPFDPKSLRMKGDYSQSREEILAQSGLTGLSDLRSTNERASGVLM